MTWITKVLTMNRGRTGGSKNRFSSGRPKGFASVPSNQKQSAQEEQISFTTA